MTGEMDRSVYDFDVKCLACEGHRWIFQVVLEPNETQKTVILTCPECETKRTITVKRQSKFPISAPKSHDEED